MSVDHQLGETKNLSRQMERVSEPRLLALLSGQRFDWFQVEVIVEMEVVQVLSMNEQVQDIVALIWLKFSRVITSAPDISKKRDTLPNLLPSL
jgi:hypothetical protein